MQLKLSRFTVARWPHIMYVLNMYTISIYYIWLYTHELVINFTCKKKTPLGIFLQYPLSLSLLFQKKRGTIFIRIFHFAEEGSSTLEPCSKNQQFRPRKIRGKLKEGEEVQQVVFDYNWRITLEKMDPLSSNHDPCILPRILKPNRICAKDISWGRKRLKKVITSNKHQTKSTNICQNLDLNFNSLACVDIGYFLTKSACLGSLRHLPIALSFLVVKVDGGIATPKRWISKVPW